MQINFTGNHVKLLRLEWGISQGELARGLNVSRRTVEAWEMRDATAIAHGYALLLRHALNCLRFRQQIIDRGKMAIRKARFLGSQKSGRKPRPRF